MDNYEISLGYGQLGNFVGIWTITKFLWNMDNDKSCR